MDRRSFLRIAGAGAATVATWGYGLGVTAGPFAEADFADLVPPDKKLDPRWVASLSAPGTPVVYSGRELQWIGMPVGGLCAGQVYLSGDGRLWLWDIFNEHHRGVAGKGTSGENYVRPVAPFSPLEQGFALRIRSEGQSVARRLDETGFSDIRFRGEYPIARVAYRDPALPVAVELEAFSPFVPLCVDDSSYPATIFRFRVKNLGDSPIEADVAGFLENAVCLRSARPGLCVRRNRIVEHRGLSVLECSAEPPPPRQETTSPRPDIVFEDFEKDTYEGWTTSGTAFGDAPLEKAEMPGYQGDVGGGGRRVVNSHNTRHGEDVAGGDAHTGTLESSPFRIERRFVNFVVGGGAHAGKTCVNLLVGTKVVRSATGKNDNRMALHSFDVSDLEGETARIQIVDRHEAGWGNIGVDDIVFSDTPSRKEPPLSELPDFGTMALALVGSAPRDRRRPSVRLDESLEDVFSTEPAASSVVGRAAEGTVGVLGRTLELEPSAEATVTFVVTWHFPNLRLPGFPETVGRHYASRFGSARGVAQHLAARLEHLGETTRLWRDTWYDSTLPRWFLDRTFANASTLATTTVHRFADGRFYGWEGVGCCAGTCTHVWHYAQAAARLFPTLERDLRERVDLGVAFDTATGGIGHRAEQGRHPADDGQEGVILRFYREHLTSADDRFLRRNWEKVRKATEYLIAKDQNGDGVIEGAQPNTLDAAWYGKIPWLVSLYLAALRAAQEMALEVGDGQFAHRVQTILERGRGEILKLFNGEYFVQEEDAEHLDAIGIGSGCHIDQVLGQSWAFQVGLGRLYGREPILSALRSLWRYNFTPDVGPFRQVYRRGRPYALAGDGGLIMCTWPKGGKRNDWEKHWQYGYFNECMSGFEYQVAGHMIWEGLVEEGLAITRTIHDRYHPSLRNPYNEIECSDHYARAMASYGVFLAACGFEYHGPTGRLGFAPRIRPENFRAAFTAAKGWGTIAQERNAASQLETVTVRWGWLRLRELVFAAEETRSVTEARVVARGEDIPASVEREGARVTLRLARDAILVAGDELEVELS